MGCFKSFPMTPSHLGLQEKAPLHEAALRGLNETVSALLAAGADVHAQDIQKRTPLHLAAENGHHETVTALLTAGADVKTRDSEQRSPLLLAILNGHHETVSVLLTAGEDVNGIVEDQEQKTPLHLAAENSIYQNCLIGDHETVSTLLAAGADMNVRDGQQMTPLHLAALKNYHTSVSALLTAGADVNALDSQQRTPLHLAARNGHHETVSALLTAGADVNVQDSQQVTPLHLAAGNGQHEMVSALLAAGACVNVQDRQRNTPLLLAVENGYHKSASVLLAAGADVNILSDREGWAPLHLALKNGHHETVSALLAAGADVNVKDSEQKTVLHLAAERCHPETVSALLAAGADMNVQDIQQRTPLHLAVENGHHETVSALLTAGADVNVRDIQQVTPLHLAAGKGHHETVSALLAAGANVNVWDIQQKTPLHLAAVIDHCETVSALLAAGADVNVRDRQQKTPLHLAAENGHRETMSALLAAGADVNVRDSQQMTPLHLAAENGHHVSTRDRLLGTDRHRAAHMGHHETVSALLAAGADVNVQDRQLRTPLHLAAKNGQHETVSALLTAGADVNVQDRQGFTPLQYATEKGHSKCVEVLLQHKADGQKKVLDTILSRLDETDVRLLMRVWSARTGEQESPGAGADVPSDLIRDMMKSEYITTGDLGMLEKDMIAAGISFPAIVQDIPGAPEELKYTRTTETAIGPRGGELEIPGFVKLIVPQGVLQQDTMITISTVDVAAILRDPESVNWLSGYPWSLGEDACPRELLDQVLFSPAVDVNLHGAQLSGPVEVQTWRPPGSEGMGCILLKHHDEEGWTDITASTVYQIYSDKISTSLQTFSPLTILWAPVDTLITVGKIVVAALSSRTLNCRFAGYIKPHTDGVEFHVVCRDRSVKTDNYKPDFTLCGSNKAMFDLYHGNHVDVTVSILQGQERSRQMKLHVQQCCEDEGQSVQMLLDRPNGKPAKGDVTISNIQVRPPETVCEFSFWECQEGDILTTKMACVHQGAGNIHKMQTHPKRLQAQAAPTDHDIRTDSSATAVARCIPIVVELKPPWRELGTNLGLSDADTERISLRHRDDTERCCLAVLEEWLHLSGTNATVEGLKTALDSAGQREIVEKLNTMEQSLRGQLLELQSEVTEIVHANFPKLNFVPDKNKEADERRIELNRRTLREEVFSYNFNFSLDSSVLDLIQKRKESVCRINWPGGSSGTGFLLSKGKIITCYHVYRWMYRAIWSAHEASRYTATFFVSTGREHKVPFESPAALLKCYSEDLDYAILQLRVEDEMERNLESLPLLAQFISESEDSRKMVVLVGHPSGGSKKVDFARIAGVVRRYIVHVRHLIQESEDKPLYDTSVMFHGSSGSPGFDTYGNVVLMHTSGFPDASSKSRIERGVCLSAIRDHARQNLAPEVFNEIFPATSEQVTVSLASLSMS